MKPHTNQGHRNDAMALSAPRQPQKKFTTLKPATPVMLPEPTPEEDLDKVADEVMDTYQGLHSILGRLVKNRALLEKKKRQEQETEIIEKLKDNLQTSHVSHLANAQLQTQRDIMLD